MSNPTDVIHAAIRELGIEEQDIVGGARLRGDLELDSTEVVEINLQVKRNLGVDVEVSLDDDPTIDDVVAQVSDAAAKAGV